MEKFDINQYISHLSLDCVIFGYKDSELKVLISKFKFGIGDWALPGGYIMKTEGIDHAANRVLRERTGLENIYLEQFRVFGDEPRIQNYQHKEAIKAALIKYDPHRFDATVAEWITSRFVSIGYYALVDINKVTPQNGEFEECLEWRNIKDVPEMTYDHNEILAYALAALRQNLDEKLIGFNLLPETFTMREIQALYEAVYDKPFAMNNFQKKILDLNVLERLEKKFTGAQNKAPYLYRFKKSL
ncbi:NUDIX hydrolase [Emticicia fontis]